MGGDLQVANYTTLYALEYIGEPQKLSIAPKPETPRYYGPIVSSETIFLCFMVLGSISLIANGFTALIISLHRRLRRKKQNAILLHVVALDTIFLALALLLILDEFHFSRRGQSLFERDTFFNTFVSIEMSLFLGVLLSVIILAIYWYVKLYIGSHVQNFNKAVTWVLFAIYILLILCTILFKWLLNNNYSSLPVMFVFISVIVFGICTFSLVLINIMHIISMRYLSLYKIFKDCIFWTLNAYFLSKLPIMLNLICQITTGRTHCTFDSMFYVYIAQVIALCNGIYVFLIMFLFDEDYRQAFLRTFCCKCSKKCNKNKQGVEEHSLQEADSTEQIKIPL